MTANDDRAPDKNRLAHGTPAERLPDKVTSAVKQAVVCGKEVVSRSTDGRFRKGQSGNPKGRPPRKAEAAISISDQPTKARLLDELLRTIPVRENDRAVEMPVRQALLRAEIAAALKGNTYAQRHLLDRIERLEREEALEVARENQVFSDYQEHCRAEIAAAVKQGDPVPEPIPHPDDIIIEPGKRVRFIGPANENEAASVHKSCQLRDVLLMQDALDGRSHDQLLNGRSEDETGSALILAIAVNATLPPRLRLSDVAMTTAMMRHHATPKRLLLKNLYHGWKGLGHACKRGQTFPPLRLVEPRLRLIYDFLAEIKRRGISPAAPSLTEITEILQDLMDRRDGYCAA
ncbi:MAG: hypothetical protein C0606_13285 [Hyphomicrobiales bacterium]|nr:MAG: hypothetical protein C0606_13285 [Hyphomicrobiales bacterium]